MNTPPFTVEHTKPGYYELKGPSFSFTYNFRADANAQAAHLNTAYLLGYLKGKNETDQTKTQGGFTSYPVLS